MLTLRASTRGAVEIRAAAGTDKAPTFAAVVYAGGAIQPDSPSLDAPLVIDLAGVTAGQTMPAILDHRDDAIVGQTDVVTVDTAIRASGVVTGDTTNPLDPAGKVVGHAKRGFQWGISMHGSFGRRLDFVPAGQTVRANGKNFTGPLYVARSTTLTAISFLSIPADPASSVAIAARRRKGNVMTFKEWCKSAGVDTATATPQRRVMLYAAAASDGAELDETERGELLHAGQDAPATADDRLRATASDLLRAGHERDIVRTRLDEALEGAWTPQRLRSAVELDGPRGQSIDNRPRAGLSGRAARPTLQCAAMLAAGNGALAEKLYGAETAQAAEDLGVRGWADLARVCLAAAGRQAPTNREELLRAASGPSTYNVANVTADAINKQVMDSFQATVPTYREIAKIVPAANFHPVKLLRLGMSGSYEKVPPGGQLKHGALEDQKLEVAPDTRGRLISIDRRDLINDDLGILAGGLAEELVRVGLNAVGDAAWAAFMDNVSFFTSAIGNRLTTATSALGIGSLSTAITALRKAKDPAGKNAGVTPFALAVPPELESAARSILTSVLLARDTSTDDSLPQGNPIPPGLRLVVEPRLSDDTISGNSETAWYLLGQPRVGVLLVAFLNGREAPIIETEQGFETLGIRLRAYHDFGAALGDYRGGVCGDGA